MYISTPHNEKELLTLVAAGNQAAFTRLFYAWHQKLGAYVYRLTESHELAEEVVQVAFIKIWTHREKLAEVENFGAYLFALSRNHAYNCLRQKARDRERKAAFSAHSQENDLNVTGVESEPDLHAILDLAVNALPEQQQKVYVLSRRQRLKYAEIAQQMNISRETVKKYLQLATLSIKKYIQNHGEMLLWALLSTLVLTAL